MDFANNLRKSRQQKNVSIAEFAAALAVSEETVTHWENGIALPPSQMLPKIATLLDASIDALFAVKSEAQQKVLYGAPTSLSAYGRITQKGVIDMLNQDYLPYGWRVVNTQFFTTAAGDDQIFVVIEK